MPARKRAPGTMAGPEGGYFHRQYGGIKMPHIPKSDKVKALMYIARNTEDRDDFQHLVDILGLDDVVDHLRADRAASTE